MVSEINSKYPCDGNSLIREHQVYLQNRTNMFKCILIRIDLIINISSK